MSSWARTDQIAPKRLDSFQDAFTETVDARIDARIAPLETDVTALKNELLARQDGPDWRFKRRKDLAEWLGCSVRQIDYWVEAGYLHPVLPPHATWPFFERADVEAFVAQWQRSDS